MKSFKIKILGVATVLLIGDFNARVATTYTESMSEIVGRYSLGETDKCGLRIL